MSIHSLGTRLIISGCVFFMLLLVVLPHLMSVHPPLVVEILLKPAECMARLIGPMLPHPNIGTPENPVYEATPLDLLVGLGLVFFCILLYPAITFLVLSLLSRILRREVGSSPSLDRK